MNLFETLGKALNPRLKKIIKIGIIKSETKYYVVLNGIINKEFDCLDVDDDFAYMCAKSYEIKLHNHYVLMGYKIIKHENRN